MICKMINVVIHKFYIYTVSILFLFISYMPFAVANPYKYLCTGETHNIYIIFDINFKKVVFGKQKPKKYWTEPNFRFWHSAKNNNVYEYTFNYSYNKLSGKLEIKSHNLVSSENKWYYYHCVINQ